VTGRPTTLLLVVALASATVIAQQEQPAFEVASIKPNTSDRPGTFRAMPGGRFEVTNTTVRGLIQVAYQRFNYDEREIIGGPGWIAIDRFDVIAQTGSGTPAVDPDGFPRELLAMFRRLLEERFHLKTHFETREGSVYVLTLVRPGTPVGPGLKPVENGCVAAMSNLTGGKPPALRPGRGPDCAFGGAPGVLIGNAITLEMLTRVLGSWELHRPVVNRTGVASSFDVDLHYRPDIATTATDAAPPQTDAPSIFTAVQEQLGLKLAADRGPVDVQVIDGIEQLTPD
jgi:uncharacterized protein (TIGR03435 family)